MPRYKQQDYSAQGHLKFFGHNLFKLTKDLAPDQPVYLYCEETIRNQVSDFRSTVQQALPQAHTQAFYATKANANTRVLKIIREQGLGVDAVSGGELARALEAGFQPSQLIFSGVGKTRTEIEWALKKNILQINVESLPELLRVAEIAKHLGIQARVALRINPAVNPKTHPYIATGFRENKFGMDLRQLQAAREILLEKHKQLNFQGLSQHIGSQLFDLSSIQEATEHALKICQDFANAGLVVKRLDVGGGLGVDYRKNSELCDPQILKRYGQILKSTLRGFAGEICFEPGRFIVARSGVLLAQVQYLKKTPYKNILVINTGMHHLIRPALYQAYHRIVPVWRRKGPMKSWEVVGPVCESSDVLGTKRRFAPLQEQDWIAILDAGAYGYSMASDYNCFAKPLEVFLKTP